MKKRFFIAALAVLSAIFLRLSAQGATLHAILVIDTVDKGIGCEYDLKSWNEQLKAIKEFSGIGLSVVVLKDDKWSHQDVLDAIGKLKPGKDDAVLFYYSGHGFRFEEKKNQWPQMALKNSSMDLYEAYSLLYAKGPRLLIAVSDSCNSYCPASPPRVMFGRGDKDLVIKNYKKLFLEGKGTIIASGCIPGQYSYGGAPDGGVYTSTLIRNIDAASRSSSATWKQILEASNQPLVGGKQQPQYKMDMDPDNSVISASITETETAGGNVDMARLEDPQWCSQAMDTRQIFNSALVEFESTGRVDKNTKQYKALEDYVNMQIGFMVQDKMADSEKSWRGHLEKLKSGNLSWAREYCRVEYQFWGGVVNKQACKKKEGK